MGQEVITHISWYILNYKGSENNFQNLELQSFEKSKIEINTKTFLVFFSKVDLLSELCF